MSSITIHDPSTAQFFADFARIGRLEPFMLRDCSLSDTAAQLGISKSLMGHWIKITLELPDALEQRVRRLDHRLNPVSLEQMFHRSSIALIWFDQNLRLHSLEERQQVSFPHQHTP